MELRCPQCGFAKEVDAATLPEGRFKVRCKQCQAPFEATREDAIEMDWGDRQARDPTQAGPAMAVAVREPTALGPTGSLREALESPAALTITLRQRVRTMEFLTGLESTARYEIWTRDGALLGRVGERSGDLVSLASRWFLQAQRPFEMLVDGTSGGIVMELKRKWSWFMATLEVWDGSGTLVGTIRQRWHFFRRRYELVAVNGRVLARIDSSFFHPWTFPVFAGPESNPTQVGLVAKKWGGFLREAFTDADKYAITLPAGDAVLRYLVFASAVLIDFGYFEHGSDPRTGGIGKALDILEWFK